MPPCDRDRPPASEVGRALLSRVARGDENAMEEFFMAYQSCVYRFAQALLNDSFAAADVLDDVMMNIWRSAGRAIAGADPLSCILALTRATAQRGAQQVDGAPTMAPFVHELSRLPVAKRAAVYLALVEDLPYDTIATVLDHDEATVCASLREAAALIRSGLAEDSA